MIKRSRCTISVGMFCVIPALFLLYSTAAMAESLSLNQCANGGIKEAVNHLQCHDGWINGNLNATKAAYAEGDFVPYRVQLTGLTPGEQYTYSFSWDILKSGKRALDYIGSYNYSVTAADACDGAAGPCPGTSTVINIPPDPALGFAPIAGQFSLFGGVLNSVGPYTTPSADVRAISVTFTPDQANAVLAWGGHISTPADWGNGNTASDIKGSPYHMSNISLVDSQGTSVASGGQDVQLSAAAVFVPSLINVSKISNADGTFAFESDVDGMLLLPVGDVASPWSLVRDQSKTIDAMKEGTVTITETTLPAGDWRIKSITCSKLGVGEVFSYIYPDDPVTDSADLTVDEAGTFDCVFENEFYGAPVLEVIKKVVGPDDACTTTVRDDVAGYETRSIHSGEEVRYCIWVTNTGADKALDVILVDDLAGLGSEIEIPLTGGSLPDEGSVDPDLPMGGWLSGTMKMTMNVPLNTTLLNTATATAIGKTDGATYMDDDSAEVKVDQASNCTLGGSVYAGSGSCPGSTTAYILKDSGTAANWCANVSWDAAAALDLTDILVTLDDQGVSNNTAPDMSPDTSQSIEVGSTTPNNDVTDTLILTGSEGGFNSVSCSGTATVTVVAPGLMLTKLASTNDICGDADDADTVEIINGDNVWYCLTVSNSGDVPLVKVLIDDLTIGLDDYTNEDLLVLEVGESQTLKFQSAPSQDVRNVAYATATEPLTDTPVGPKMGAAQVNVLSADIEVSKSVDPDHIIFCETENWKDFCTEQIDQGKYDTSYTISVKNNGPSLATAVTLDDDLPFGFIYASDDKGCLYDLSTHSLSCALGDIAAGATVEVQITGEIDVTLFDLPWQRLTNQACANTDPVRLDPDRSNNCDSVTTQISTGPTRTIGWWSTHPNGLAACIAASPEFEIDLGFLTIRTEAEDNEIDATVSTNVSAKGKHKSSLITPKLLKDLDSEATSAEHMAKGVLNARTANWRDGTKRSHIGQSRIHTAKQLTAAWCNEVTFGSEFDFYYLGWVNIRLIMNGEAYLQGGAVKDCSGLPCEGHLNQVIQSIKLIGGVADLFNNAGDDLDNGLPSERAYPKAPQDDPTDPTD